MIDAQRVDLERRFNLINGERSEATTWVYQLADASTANIKAIVQNERVDDTAHLNRIRYRPEFTQDRSRQILAYSLAMGGIGAALFLVVSVRSRRTKRSHFSWSTFTAALSSRPAPRRTGHAVYSRHATAAVLLAGILAASAMTWFAAASFWSALGALVVVYTGGYLVGALLVHPLDEPVGLAWAVIRTVAGLLLTTLGFLLSLVLSLPWFVPPVVLVAAAVYVHGRAAFFWPSPVMRVTGDGVVAAILVLTLLSPVVISVLYMAPGAFPPVFYNVDTAYFLEKVHALIAADSYPPPSLSNLGGLRTYHFGTQAMAALISRSSGLLPHHSAFLVVLPLLIAGVISAAIAAARYVSPALPRSITIPLLVISVPALSGSFWDTFGPLASGFPVSAIAGEYGLWGILSNEGQNIGGDFLILASIASIAAAPSHGWRLPAFLIGTAILVKTPVGVALAAGFMLMETYRVLSARRRWPSPQIVAAGTVFIATFAVFWILTSIPPDFHVELYPLFHLRRMAAQGRLSGVVIDALWLFLPVLIVLLARIKDPDRQSTPLLLFGIAPFVVVNATRQIDMRPGGGGPDSDWLQVLHPVPFLLHAFALSLASRRWAGLGLYRRGALLVVLLLVILPAAAAAAAYSLQVLRDRESGYEFVDNHVLAEALAVIPTSGTLIVTNDLRYPAQGFTRDNRQMQIPAIFGHQAFAVNYAYEIYPFSRERRRLQDLLQTPEWSEAIAEAAGRYRWTHLVIRKDYVHPAPIPLERIFENRSYAVYRFQ